MSDVNVLLCAVDSAMNTLAAFDRDRADVGKRCARFVERLTGDPGNCLNVCAAGDFGNDPAVKTVYVDLRRDDVGADDPLFRVHFDNGGGGFVAGTFKSEN